MKKAFLLFSLAMLAGLGVATSAAQAESFSCNGDPFYSRTGTGKTTVASRLRSQPCMDDSEILTVIPANKEISVLGEMDGWYKVKFGDRYGWVGSRLINAGNSTKGAETKSQTKAETKTINFSLKDVIGINEANYGLLAKGNKALLKRLKNKVVMRVHARGEMYSVTANGLQKVTIKMLDETQEDDKTDDNDKPTSSNGVLALKAEIAGSKAQLTWTASGSAFSQGFKVVRSETANPVYPGNEYHYLSDPTMRTDSWDSGFKAGKTYHFRVCEYLGGKCGAYSNNVSLTWPQGEDADDESDKSISLSVTTSGDKASLNWSLSGFDSDMGFKVVVSENPNPVYPGNDYHYYSESSKRSDTWGGLESGQTYHFRVCEYLGGKCGVYSNDVSWVAP
ncbi:MAG: SH3 domain-containing protein [Patescibacteria group bacterium]|nr:SH3 domain-containing protein [Patescibacteria group bacterium]